MTVTYRVANDGNVRVSGSARIRVEGPPGMRVANSELIEIPELLPDSEIRTVPGVFPAAGSPRRSRSTWTARTARCRR